MAAHRTCEAMMRQNMADQARNALDIYAMGADHVCEMRHYCLLTIQSS